ncbi:MAG: hypothetical protein JWO05_3548 [Gemmatimonadetes bacterium]|nr:hypothetical protein [Gemmatimonadota bacterium]
MPIIARFTATQELLYRAQVDVMRNLKWMRLGGVFVVVVFPLLMFAMNLTRGLNWLEALTGNLFWIVGFPVLWLVGIPLVQRWSAHRAFHATPAAQGDRTYTFDENNIVLEGGLSSGRLTWPAIIRVVETRALFLLFISNQSAHFLPKSALASERDLQAFRTLCQVKVVETKLYHAQVPGDSLSVTAPTPADAASLDFQCAFCGALVEESPPLTLAILLTDGGEQHLPCHRNCLRRSLHSSVPLAI